MHDGLVQIPFSFFFWFGRIEDPDEMSRYHIIKFRYYIFFCIDETGYF